MALAQIHIRGRPLAAGKENAQVQMLVIMSRSDESRPRSWILARRHLSQDKSYRSKLSLIRQSTRVMRQSDFHNYFQVIFPLKYMGKCKSPGKAPVLSCPVGIVRKFRSCKASLAVTLQIWVMMGIQYTRKDVRICGKHIVISSTPMA